MCKYKAAVNKNKFEFYSLFVVLLFVGVCFDTHIGGHSDVTESALFGQPNLFCIFFLAKNSFHSKRRHLTSTAHRTVYGTIERMIDFIHLYKIRSAPMHLLITNETIYLE